MREGRSPASIGRYTHPGWLPVQALETVAADPQVDYLRLPEQVSLFDLDAPAYTTEGLAVINGPAWHTAGFRGQGSRWLSSMAVSRATPACLAANCRLR